MSLGAGYVVPALSPSPCGQGPSTPQQGEITMTPRRRPVYSALISVRINVTVKQAVFLNAAARTLGISRTEFLRRILQDTCDYWVEKGAYSHPPASALRPHYPAVNDGQSRV